MARPRLPTLFLLPVLVHAQGMGGGRVLPRESPKAQVDRESPALIFQDVAREWGLTRSNVYGGVKAKKAILEMTGNGAALVDVDNDGLLDVILINGTRIGEDDPPGALFYRNRGGRLEDATTGSGLTRRGWGQGVCAGDYDNDGFTDLLVTYYGHNALYRNRGGERFEETTAASGLPVSGSAWGTGCAFLDYDLDGDLDLFVSNYITFDERELARDGAAGKCTWRGMTVFCGPRGYPSGRNWLFQNTGKGKFRDVSREAGILLEGELRYGLGVVASDFDDDGDADIYVACDSTPSLLYRNEGSGKFKEIGALAGVAYGAEGQEQGSMGAAAGDYDNDGRLDLAASNFIDETPTLYRNEGDMFFTDETYAAGVGVETRRVGWGAVLVDFDQDGWKDFLIANGHIYPELEAAAGLEHFRQPALAFWNLRNGAFRNVSTAWGPALAEPRVSRGAATGDIDGDGRPEVLVVNMNAKPSLLQVQGPAGSSILVSLQGTVSNRSAIGARVVVVSAGGVTQTDEVRSGGSYASQSDLRLHFGLGTAEKIDRLEVRWPLGKTEVFEGLPTGAEIAIVEGRGTPAVKPFTR